MSTELADSQIILSLFEDSEIKGLIVDLIDKVVHIGGFKLVIVDFEGFDEEVIIAGTWDEVFENNECIFTDHLIIDSAGVFKRENCQT
jgi:hypothetical protein